MYHLGMIIAVMVSTIQFHLIPSYNTEVNNCIMSLRMRKQTILVLTRFDTNRAVQSQKLEILDLSRRGIVLSEKLSSYKSYLYFQKPSHMY